VLLFKPRPPAPTPHPSPHLGTAGVSDTGSRTMACVSLAPKREALPGAAALAAYARTTNAPRLAGASKGSTAVPSGPVVTVLKSGTTAKSSDERSAAPASCRLLDAAG
jgi:hypothetical protein